MKKLKTFREWLKEAFVPGQGAGNPFGDEGVPRKPMRTAGDPFGGERGITQSTSRPTGGANLTYVLQKLAQLDSNKQYTMQDLIKYFGSPEAAQLALQQNNREGIWRQYGDTYVYVQSRKWNNGR